MRLPMWPVVMLETTRAVRTRAGGSRDVAERLLGRVVAELGGDLVVRFGGRWRVGSAAGCELIVSRGDVAFVPALGTLVPG